MSATWIPRVGFAHRAQGAYLRSLSGHGRCAHPYQHCRDGAVRASGNGNGTANGNGSSSSSGMPQLPKELEGLAINSEGLLIDEKTGDVINEFGATRFDIAVHAIRGEFDPPAGVDNTENNTGVLLGSLKSFPLDYTFTVVARQSQDTTSLVDDVRQTISRVCGIEVPAEDCRATERLNGKFLSVRVTARVSAAAMLDRVFAELGKDTRIMMRY